MRVGIIQANTIIGDIAGNQTKILQFYKDLCSKDAQLVVTPELAITGYPPKDLILKSQFVKKNLDALNAIAKEVEDIPLVIGFIDSKNNILYNAAAWCENGTVKHIGRKCLLPSYDVFDETRYFEPGLEPTVVNFKGKKIAITICEDIWNNPLSKLNRTYTNNPINFLKEKSPDLILNLSASPWFMDKEHIRTNLVTDISKRCQCPVIYCNAVGGHDELIFDGHSFLTNKNGDIIYQLKDFQEDIEVIDTEAQVLTKYPQKSSISKIEDALILGVKDYLRKTGFKRVVLGLSGGIDSAVTAAIATKALGAKNVMGIALPSKISSKGSVDDAKQLAKNLGIDFHIIPITEIVESTESALNPLFKNQPRGIAEENIQARARGLILMSISNKFGSILLSTGNKSELAVGYCTLYGDMAGGLAVISDLPKTKVYELAKHINKDSEIIPQNTITKEPSAELSENQKDSDTLPPYEILDQIVKLYIEEHLPTDEIINTGIDANIVKKVIKMIDLNEYKRKQAAPGFKISPLAFGSGRRIPIAQKYIF